MSFFTPIIHLKPQSWEHSLMNHAEEYFYLNDETRGQKAYVIDGTDDQIISLMTDPSSFVITALKIVSYFSIILPAILLCVKLVLRFRHNFQELNVEELQRIEVNAEHIRALREILPNIERGIRDPRIEWISEDAVPFRSFKLREFPNVIFKSNPFQSYQSPRARLDFLTDAKKVCLVHGLDLIEIPRCQELVVESEGTHHSFLVEERLPFQPTESAQEELYRTQVHRFHNTAKQLCTLFLYLNCQSVNWKTIPILENSAGTDCRVGFFANPFEYRQGNTGRSQNTEEVRNERGLVRCLFSEEQIDEVIGRLEDGSSQSIRESRLREIQEHQQLLGFYQRNGILENPSQAIQLDIDTLPLNMNEEGVIREPRREHRNWVLSSRTITMREAVQKVLDKLNAHIRRSSVNEAPKGRRLFQFKKSMNFGLFCIEGANRDWIGRILNALKESGRIFSFSPLHRHNNSNNNGYIIQA